MADLAPFVPRLAVELAGEPGNLSRTLPGSMLSADISGFTALTEKLADQGKAGAEEITIVINECFTALIDAAYGFAGQVLKFGGDAVLILFLGADHERRCAAAALAMQTALHTNEAAIAANLTMTVGAETGEFEVFLVGSNHRELIITGATADRVIEYEAAAPAAGVLVGQMLADRLPSAALLHGSSDHGGVTIGAGIGLEPSAPVRRWVDPSHDWSTLVPPTIASELEAVETFEGEHRIVSIGFIQVRGVGRVLEEHGREALAADLGGIVDRIVGACTRFDCNLLHTDIAPDGLKFLLAAGAPLSGDNDEDALVRTLLEAMEGDSLLDRRSAAARGRVFAGFLGASYRRAYTTMGDATNTAARLLPAAANGDVVVSDELLRHTATEFVTEALPPIQAKGKREPLSAHRVDSAIDGVKSANASLAVVGRDPELDVLRTALRVGGRTIELVGPAGVGKSRLLDTVIDEAYPRLTLVAGCSRYTSFSPYAVSRTLLRTGLGLDLALDRATCGKQLTKIVNQNAKDLLPLLPLLSGPIGADLAPTKEARDIDPASRRAVTHRVLFDLIDRLTSDPVVVVIEDVQWIDDASGDLLTQLVREAPERGWVTVITRRPGGLWTVDPEAATSTSLELGPLSSEATRQLAIAAALEALPDHALAQVVERAEGSPLFAIELARAFSVEGALPESIESVISTRIDRLPPGHRRLLRIASVLGTEISLDDLAAVTEEFAPEIDPQEIHALSDLFEPTDDGVAFIHALYRDTAYEGLPFRQRRQLHRLVGERLESRLEGEVADDAPVLALHFSEAHVHDKAWNYAILAARRAHDQAANVEAAESYRRALDASAHHEVDDTELAGITEEFGDICIAVGQFEEAFHAFARTRRLLRGIGDEVRLMRKQGLCREREGKLSTALRWLTRALSRIPDDTADRELIKNRAALELAYSGVRHRQGRNDACADWARRALADAERSDDREILARALDRLHLASLFAPSVTRGAEHALRALELHEERNDFTSMARTLVNLGVQMHFAHRWDDALDYYARAARAGERAGDVIEANIGRMNRAEILSDRGSYDEAEAEFVEVLRNWSAAGWLYGELVSRSNLALCRARRGDPDPTTTTEELQAVLGRFEEIAADDYIVETSIRLAEAHVLDGDAARARRRLEPMLDDATDPKSAARVHRVAAMAAMLDDELDTAEEHLRHARTLALESRAVYEEGVAYLADAELAHRRGDAERRGALQAEARTLLEPLGIERVSGLTN